MIDTDDIRMMQQLVTAAIDLTTNPKVAEAIRAAPGPGRLKRTAALAAIADAKPVLAETCRLAIEHLERCGGRGN